MAFIYAVDASVDASIMELCSSSKLLPCAISLGLFTIFAREVTVSFVKWRESKEALSVKEIKCEYVKFPSISICLDKDVPKKEIGFKKMRPLNETFTFIQFVQHTNNGCDNTFEKNSPPLMCFWTSDLICQG